MATKLLGDVSKKVVKGEKATEVASIARRVDAVREKNKKDPLKNGKKLVAEYQTVLKELKALAKGGDKKSAKEISQLMKEVERRIKVLSTPPKMVVR